MKKGQWVESDQGVGIYIVEKPPAPPGPDADDNEKAKYAAAASGFIAEWVHLTNADGTTMAQIPARVCSNLRLARASSIPAARIEHLSAEQLEKLGYVG